MHIRWLALLLAVSLTLGGCNTLRGLGQPDLDPSLLVSTDARNLVAPPPPGSTAQPPPLLPDCVTAINWEKSVTSNSTGKLVGSINGTSNQGPDVYEIYRNKCIYVYINAIDLSFDQFKAHELALVGGFNATADIGSAILTTASAAAGAKEAKTILAGIAALLLTTKQVVSADVLYNTSIIVILQQMDADRRQAEATILLRMQDGSSTATTTTTTTSGAAGSTSETTSTTAKVISGKITQKL